MYENWGYSASPFQYPPCFFLHAFQLAGAFRVDRLEVQEFLEISLLPDQGKTGPIGKIEELAQTARKKIQSCLFHLCMDQLLPQGFFQHLGGNLLAAQIFQRHLPYLFRMLQIPGIDPE